MANKRGKSGNSNRFLFSWAPKSLQMVTAATKLKGTCFFKGKLWQFIKNKDITLLIKVHLVKAIVFSVVMYGCESWTLKKAEHQSIDAFELWCWRRRSQVPWTARRSNQSILKEINPEYSLEELLMKLKLQYFGHLMWKANSLERILMQEKTEGKRRRGWWSDVR